jgi:transcriptional regulator with XRE-family HTH domain
MPALPSGDELKQARLERGLSVDELAKKSGVNRVTIYRIEQSPKKSPPPRTAAKLVRALAKIPKLPKL